MHDEVKKRAEELLRQGQDLVMTETAAKLYQQKAALIEQAAGVASETIDKVEKLASDGNAAKKEIAAIVTRGLLGAMGQVASGRLEPQEERASIEDNPFSGNSSVSTRVSTVSPLALTHDESSSPSPKRRVGRPKGSKNQAKPQG